MKNEDLIEERQYDAEYEEHLREVDIVKARAEDHAGSEDRQHRQPRRRRSTRFQQHSGIDSGLGVHHAQADEDR